MQFDVTKLTFALTSEAIAKPNSFFLYRKTFYSFTENLHALVRLSLSLSTPVADEIQSGTEDRRTHDTDPNVWIGAPPSVSRGQSAEMLTDKFQLVFHWRLPGKAG